MSRCNVIDVQNPDFKTSPVNIPHRHLYYFQMLVDKSVCLCVAMRVHLCARLCFSLAFVCLLRFVCHSLGIGGQHMLLISRSLFLSACLSRSFPLYFLFLQGKLLTGSTLWNDWSLYKAKELNVSLYTFILYFSDQCGNKCLKKHW